MKELDHIVKWSIAQLKGGLPERDVAQSQKDVVRRKVRLLKGLEYDQAIPLIEKINEIQEQVCWTKEDAIDIIVDINAKLRRPDSTVDGARSRRDNQECPTFELYLTAEEHVEAGRLDLSDFSFMKVVKGRCKAIGLILPSEATKGRMAEMLRLLKRKGDMAPQEFKKLLDFVKKEMMPLHKFPWDKEFVTNYPENPDHLQRDIYDHAYPSTPPGKLPIEGMDSPEFLRSSSAKLKPKYVPTVVMPSPTPDWHNFGHLFAHAMGSLGITPPHGGIERQRRAWHQRAFLDDALQPRNESVAVVRHGPPWTSPIAKREPESEQPESEPLHRSRCHRAAAYGAKRSHGRKHSAAR